MKLYLPEKYKVIQGKGENVALCTVWNDPDIIVKQKPEILDKVAIISSLYGKEGVNIMLRNLCLNPQIRYVLVWAANNLSKTPIGRTGLEVLEKAFSDGIKDGAVDGFKLHENMDFEVVKKTLANVQLVDVSHMDIHGVAGHINKCDTKGAYMEPAEFPVYERKVDTFPSEEVGWIVRGNKIADTWLKYLDRIIRYGTVKPTEYGNSMKELACLTRVIKAEDTENPHIPDLPKEIKDLTGLKSKGDIDSYVQSVFLEKELPAGTVYTYGQRLRAYPANGNFLDQIDFIIKKMKECNVSRRAVAVVWNPAEDQPKSSPACFTHFQVMQNIGKLHAFAVFRSQDMFKAGLLNEFGLRRIQENIAKELGMQVGSLTVTTNSAHIYEEDWGKVKELCKNFLWDKKVDLIFDEHNTDPRGNVIVNLVGEKIIADIVSPTGEQLLSLEGKSAKELCLKMAELDLLSVPAHYMDIARQLQKAEIARDLGINFKQDRQLPLEMKR